MTIGSLTPTIVNRGHGHQSFVSWGLAAVGEIARSIEHVGSTAVPGLAAKPVIDLVIVVESEDDAPEAIRRLEAVDIRFGPIRM